MTHAWMDALLVARPDPGEQPEPVEDYWATLTPRQYDYLKALWDHGVEDEKLPGRVTMASNALIKRWIGVSANQTVSAAIKRLEEHGYIECAYLHTVDTHRRTRRIIHIPELPASPIRKEVIQVAEGPFRGTPIRRRDERQFGGVGPYPDRSASADPRSDDDRGGSDIGEGDQGRESSARAVEGPRDVDQHSEQDDRSEHLRPDGSEDQRR